MAYRRFKRRAPRRRRRRPAYYRRRRFGARRLGNLGFFHTKEQVLTDYSVRMNGNGFAIVNGFSTALVNQYPDNCKMEDINQDTQYSNLWRSYKITGCSYTFIPPHTNSLTTSTIDGTQTQISEQLPLFWWRLAKTPEENPDDENGIINMCPKMVQFRRPVTVYVRNPKALTSVWSGPESTATQTEAMSKYPKWLDLEDSPDVKHLTLQWGLAFGQANITVPLKVIKKIYFSLKDPK